MSKKISFRFQRSDKSLSDKKKEVPVAEENPVRTSTSSSKWEECARPILASTYSLSRDDPWYRRFCHNFLCPPHSRMGAIVFFIVLVCSTGVTLYSLFGEAAEPGSFVFALFTLFVACWIGGYFVYLIGLPPLLGMLLVGAVLGVFHEEMKIDAIHCKLAANIRTIGLCVILLRAGLGLDPEALKQLSYVVIRLAICPCLMEAFTDTIVTHFLLGLPWFGALMMGFVMAPVSPAVVVTCMLGLADKGYGLDKGVPTLIIAACSIDTILAIIGFGVALGVSFSSDSIIWALVKGPLEGMLGLVFGFVAGIILWYIPQESSNNRMFFRVVLLLTFTLMAMFGSKRINMAGIGPMAILTLAFVVGLRWRKEDKETQKSIVDHVAAVLWMIFQPLLFGLIGAHIHINSLTWEAVGKGAAVLGIGLSVRTTTVFLVTHGTELNPKERLFIAIAWLPKATIQAAIGVIALDTALTITPEDDEKIQLGRIILHEAVLAILLTVPVGSILVMSLGPRLLEKSVLEISRDELIFSNLQAERNRMSQALQNAFWGMSWSEFFNSRLFSETFCRTNSTKPEGSTTYADSSVHIEEDSETSNSSVSSV